VEEPVNVAEVAMSSGLLDEVERAVVGKRDALELVLLGLLADGHVDRGLPGLAKTLIARSFAQATDSASGASSSRPT
jgi:MoxR-like ATPase